MLRTPEQLSLILERSRMEPAVIFKHSTRCALSSMVKSRLERAGNPPGVTFYLLDLIRYRALSAQVAELFSVPHESPQLLLVRDGRCSFHESHQAISMEALSNQL